MSKARGSSGRKYTHWTGSCPKPKAAKMARTIAVKMIDSQR